MHDLGSAAENGMIRSSRSVHDLGLAADNDMIRSSRSAYDLGLAADNGVIRNYVHLDMCMILGQPLKTA